MIPGNYIDGQWTLSRTGPTFEKCCPADARDVIGAFPDSDVEEVKEAVTAARRALPAWRALSYDARAQFLFKAADGVAARQNEIASALTREEGKSLPEAFREHGLEGEYAGFTECHVDADWLLVCRATRSRIHRTGTHRDLFRPRRKRPQGRT